MRVISLSLLTLGVSVLIMPIADFFRDYVKEQGKKKIIENIYLKTDVKT